MEKHCDSVSSIYAKYKRNYEIQLVQTKEMNHQSDVISKENEILKNQIKNLTTTDQINEGRAQMLHKSLAEMKMDNSKLKEDKGKLEDTIKKMRVKLKEALKINLKLTKQLEDEKQAKENLLKLREQFNEESDRMKMLVLEEMNKQLKEKLQFNTNMNRDLAVRFDCDLSDLDDTKTNPSETCESNQNVYRSPKSSPESVRSSLTGIPSTDIKAQIVSNYKLIKQLEEEIVSLNKLRVKIKAAPKIDLKKVDG